MNTYPKTLERVIRAFCSDQPDNVPDLGSLGALSGNGDGAVTLGQISELSVTLHGHYFFYGREVNEAREKNTTVRTSVFELSEIFKLLFWESIYSDFPKAQDYISNALPGIIVLNDGSVKVIPDSVEMNPTLADPDHCTNMFFPRLCEIFRGESPYKDLELPEIDVSGINMGTMENRFTRQLVLLLSSLRQHFHHEIPETSLNEIQRGFADLPLMEYLRYRRLYGRFDDQIKLMRELVSRGLRSEDLDADVLSKLKKDGYCCEYFIDQSWKIILVPTKEKV